MKGFYEWYRKHITGAIFGGLILGILTGLFLAGRFKVVLTATSVLGNIYIRSQERQCCSSCAPQRWQVLSG